MNSNKIDVFSHMTKEMKEVINIQEERAINSSSGGGFKVLRKEYEEERKFWNEGAPDLEKVKNFLISGPHGDIPVRIYYPNDKKENSCSLFIHGGGFILGSPNTHDRMARLLSLNSGNVVVAIDYKLSPEYKFPVAIEECVYVAKYLNSNADEFNIKADDISLVGDSGGANLALATNLWLRDKESDNSFISSLILFYGLFGLKDSISRRTLGGSLDGLSKEDLEYYETCYLNNKEETYNPYYDCLSSDLSYGIPPVYIAVGDLDPLLDDSLALEKILKEKKIFCKCEIYSGLLHAFLHYTKFVPEANEVIKNASEFLKNKKSK